MEEVQIYENMPIGTNGKKLTLKCIYCNDEKAYQEGLNLWIDLIVKRLIELKINEGGTA